MNDILVTSRNVGLTKAKEKLSKRELRIKARELGGDTTHLGDPPATYPEGAHEGDRVSIRANLCCSAWPGMNCEGYVKFVMDGVATRVPSTSYSIPRNACRWSPEYHFTMPNYDVIVTIEPWEEDPWNPDDKGDSVDIFIKYLKPEESPPSKDPLDTVIIWFETVRPRCPLSPLEALVSGTANLVIRITPKIPILPG